MSDKIIPRNKSCWCLQGFLLSLVNIPVYFLSVSYRNILGESAFKSGSIRLKDPFQHYFEMNLLSNFTVVCITCYKVDSARVILQANFVPDFCALPREK